MDHIMESTKELWAQADEPGRGNIQRRLQELLVSFDTDWDVVMRLASGPLTLALVKIGVTFSIFQILADANGSVTVVQFAQRAAASEEVLRRILRTQAAFNLIEQTAADAYKANRMTAILADGNVSGAVLHIFDTLGPIMQAVPSFLCEHRPQAQATVSSMGTDTAFQRAFNTDLPAAEWMAQHPDRLQSLSHFMAMQRDAAWTDRFSVTDEVAAAPPALDPAQAYEAVALVDVGGGYGHQARLFHEKYPQLGPVVVQDTAAVLERLPPTPSASASGSRTERGVVFQAHDFFEQQPVQGAKFYYFRHVLHDWADAECVQILRATMPALAPWSRIIVDEVVLPDLHVPWQAAWQDMVMAAALGGCERSETEWGHLLAEAGLKIVDIVRYDSKMQCAIVAAPV
ncbi:hypothetical protein BDW74DRAFT_120606 [Aspergillus multicolor]|uniref:uncharacterized protein n=1 Tax=Aspergillus multicolor TaxID=41759 RepID=UPI003CCDD1A7